jgi:hypothetical protein
MDPNTFDEIIKPLTKLIPTSASPRGPHKMPAEEYADTCRIVALPSKEVCENCGLTVTGRTILHYVLGYGTRKAKWGTRCYANGGKCPRYRALQSKTNK